jgi:hypothetical protein
LNLLNFGKVVGRVLDDSSRQEGTRWKKPCTYQIQNALDIKQAGLTDCSSNCLGDDSNQLGAYSDKDSPHSAFLSLDNGKQG